MIIAANEDMVAAFLDVAGNSLSRFRYFARRPTSVIRTHQATLVGIDEDGKPVSYGHLDPEDGKTWLGICVAEGERGRGHGTDMMNALLKKARSTLWLSVDHDNGIARRMYERFGFVIQDRKGNVCFYTKEHEMADTFGSLVDKLITIDLKMWNNQELLYEIRRMSFEEFKEKYWNKEDGAQRLWECLKKACDLNVQRNQIIDEMDETLVRLLEASARGDDLDDGRTIQRKHKTY